MKKLINTLFLSALFLLGFSACEKEDTATADDQYKISDEVLSKIKKLGFSTQGAFVTEGGYLVEGDIVLTDELLNSTPDEKLLRVADAEQYRTTNLVKNLPRVIKIYAPQGGSKGYSPGMIAGLDLAIDRYNAEGLQITFQRITTSTGANIKMSRLTKYEENQGILGSSGFPTATGKPYGTIKMSGVLESAYNLTTGGIATIIAHEMGHCIGFRHTDYYNRAISCGGAVSNEGASTVGAILIPGTPSTANPASDLSWMLACTDGGDRPFTGNDMTALNYLY